MKRPVSILIVEDEVLTAMCLTQELKAFGFSILQNATSGEQAIRITKEESPDIILMDIRLAGKLNGIEALDEIRKSKAVPAIIMTGYSDEDLKKKASQLNSLAFLIKPVNAREIKKIIDQTFL